MPTIRRRRRRPRGCSRARWRSASSAWSWPRPRSRTRGICLASTARSWRRWRPAPSRRWSSAGSTRCRGCWRSSSRSSCPPCGRSRWADSCGPAPGPRLTRRQPARPSDPSPAPSGWRRVARARRRRPAGPRTARPPNRRAVLTRAFLLIAIVVVVFVVLLPRVIDYGAVRDALSTLSATQLLVLVLATVIAYVANALPARVLLPALSWPRAVGADLAARAVVSTIPGPTDVAVRFVLYRQWGLPADAATAAIVFAAFFETLSVVVLPLIATAGVLVTGETTRPAILWLSVIGVAVL